MTRRRGYHFDGQLGGFYCRAFRGKVMPGPRRKDARIIYGAPDARGIFYQGIKGLLLTERGRIRRR